MSAAARLGHKDVAGVDICDGSASLGAVIRLRLNVIAPLLVALWLLATQHCGLEAAGLWASHPAAPDQACCPSGGTHCTHDGCDTVEGGNYRIDGGVAAVPAPQFTECGCLLCDDLPVSWLESWVDEPPRQSFERPMNWVPTWHFVQRAALSPRAPSLAVA